MPFQKLSAARARPWLIRTIAPQPPFHQKFGPGEDFIINHPKFGGALDKRDLADCSRELIVA